MRQPRHEAVTHRIKSVRHHRINFSIPTTPAEDEEAFVIVVPDMRSTGEIRLRPQDFQQFIACLVNTRDRIMGAQS